MKKCKDFKCKVKRTTKKVFNKENTRNYLWVILGVAFLALLFYGGSKGWFQFIINNNPTQPPLDISPNQQNPEYNSCNQVCSSNGFNKFYSFVDSCKNGETKITYGYPGQAPLLTCCCFTEETPQPKPQGTCTESDGGNVLTIPSTTTASDGVARMDVCVDNTRVQEYWCNSDGTWTGGIESCDPGQTCLSSRSGGYCKTKSWNDGDTVYEGSGSGSTIGSQEGFAEIDLGDYGLSTGGTCQLGARLSVNWNYANDKCVGIPGAEGMKWRFYDSLGLEYERDDISPTSWVVDLHPRGHILNWDGHTNWRAYANHNPGNLPECLINYQYTVKVYIYDCI